MLLDGQQHGGIGQGYGLIKESTEAVVKPFGSTHFDTRTAKTQTQTSILSGALSHQSGPQNRAGFNVIGHCRYKNNGSRGFFWPVGWSGLYEVQKTCL